MSRKVILSEEEINKALKRIAHEIIEREDTLDDVVLVGIKSRGDQLALRIARIIETISKTQRPLGALDITLYRDDLTTIAEQPVVQPTELNIDIDNKRIVLIDDVLFTGRTIRCALNQLIDYGRPRRIELAVLVDRGHRELPVRADYVGKNIPTGPKELVKVWIREVDDIDQVTIEDKDG